MSTHTRRQFLKRTAAAAAAPTILPSTVFGANAPSNRVTIGMIGVGGHGTGVNLKGFLGVPDAHVIAVCDVFRDRREAARDLVNQKYGTSDCADCNDFREILGRADIDAVAISTPDHWHVPLSIYAARAGKDVFCEKPTLTIAEGRALMDVMRRTGVVYQGGIEDRSVIQYHRMAELARNGALGRIERIHVTLPPGDLFPTEQPAPVPDGFDYDLWLGPAPYTPYTPTKTGAQEWRNSFDYSGGKLTDWGAHLMDTAQVALFEELGGPVTIEGKGVFPENAMTTTALQYQISYRYAGGAELFVESGGTGITIYGSDGWVGNSAWRRPLDASDPDLLRVAFPPQDSKIWPMPPGEHQDFIDSVKSRQNPLYPPEAIHHLSTAMHLGNISMILGRKLTWDPAKEEFPNDPEANRLQSRAMRAPWTL